jgi:hypothetical protein
MASTVLTRTPSSAGNRKTWTYSMWFKRAHTGIESALFSVGANSSSDMCMLRFDPDIINLHSHDSSAGRFSTKAKFRDVNGWYHLVMAFNSTLATSDDRIKFYVNGERIPTSDLQNVSTVTQNTDSNVNSTSTIYIGERPDSNMHFEGSMSHINFIDGTAYDASYFGETDATTGEWKIKTSPSVTYGTNGFFILKDGNSVTDQSGNSNNFTVAGGTLTKTEDSPSNVFATLNPLLDVNNSPTFSNGNTTATGSSSGSARFTGSTICVSTGKWYYEIKVTVGSSSPYVGVIDAQSTLRRNSSYFVGSASGDNDSGYALNMTGDIYHNNSNSYASNIGNTSTGDILGFAIDLDSAQRTCEIYKNGVSQRSFNLAEPSSGAYMLACSSINNQSGAKAEVNFGNGYFGTTAVSSAGTNASGIGIFEHDVPANHTALSTKGLNL